MIMEAISISAIVISGVALVITVLNATKEKPHQCKCDHTHNPLLNRPVVPKSSPKVVYFTEDHDKKLRETMENE